MNKEGEYNLSFVNDDSISNIEKSNENEIKDDFNYKEGVFFYNYLVKTIFILNYVNKGDMDGLSYVLPLGTMDLLYQCGLTIL